MKKDVVMYKNGSIVDFQGNNHPFVVCALSTSSFNNDGQTVEIGVYNNYDGDYLGSTEAARAVFIGISVCNPVDEWDEEKGKMIAYNKAKGFKASNPAKSAAIFATRAGMISEGLVQALLDREVQHVIDDPEYVIKGYNRMKERFLAKQEMQKYVSETPQELVEIAEKLNSLNQDQIERVMNVALIKSDE